MNIGYQGGHSLEIQERAFINPCLILYSRTDCQECHSQYNAVLRQIQSRCSDRILRDQRAEKGQGAKTSICTASRQGAMYLQVRNKEGQGVSCTSMWAR